MNISDKYNKILSDDAKKIISFCSSCADRNGFKIYIVGGAVRDIILEEKSFDIDLLIEGDAYQYVQKLVLDYPDVCSIKDYHKDFNTLKIDFKLESKIFTIDIASTRQEAYPEPACLPVVTKVGCSLEEDAIRRDFTINAMAMSLNSKNFGTLFDNLGGFEDLKNKKIRILHPQSFIDDPTRIVRALKFRIRFGFDLEEETQKLQNDCIQSGLFNDLGSERMKSELKQTFNLNSENAYNIYIYEKIFTFVDADIDTSKLPSGGDIKQSVDAFFDTIENRENLWLIYICCLLAYSSDREKLKETCKKLNLTAFETETILCLKEIFNKFEALENAKTNSEIYEILSSCPNESIIALHALSSEKIKKNIYIYIRELKNVQIFTTGRDLINAGIIPGPMFGSILKKILYAKLNNEISTREDEKNYILKIANRINRN